MITESLLSANFSIDSRTTQEGDVFLAIKGAQLDGNDFVLEALAKGALFAVSEREFNDKRVITVDDVYKYMINLSKIKRSKLSGKVIGITGSVGKTTCKEYLYSHLKLLGKTYSSFGNFNNHIGLPLSILNTPLDTEFCIYELGINHIGEMAFLSNLTKPDIAIITNISTTHIEFFDSIIKIADEKFHIVDTMCKGGYLLLNADDAFSKYLSKKAEIMGINTVFYHGIPVFEILKLLELNKSNNIQNLKLSLKGRGEKHTLLNGAILIDHSYNASLESMRYAIREVENYPNKRKIAVLGNMLELGSMSETLHYKILPMIDKYKIDKVIMCGTLFKNVFEHINQEKKAFYSDNVQQIIPFMQQFILPNDVVIVKGSHSTQLDKLVESLLLL